MSGQIKIEFIGWQDDFRYTEEKKRVTEHVEQIAKAKGFTFAQVQSATHPNYRKVPQY
jgi:hypothetical protein